jgi:hypothetical protein
MQVALISPYSMQREIPNTGCHLILAHLLGTRIYRDFALAVSGRKILDNGAAEHQLVRPEELPYLATSIGATEIIVPDAMSDGPQTMRYAKAFHRVARDHAEFDYIGVVQGATAKQRLTTLDYLMSLDYITKYAIPRNVVVQQYERVEFLAEVWGREPSLKFHALGSSRWCEEVKVLSNLPNVESTDTAMPIKLALEGYRLEPETVYKVRPHNGEFFESDDRSKRELVRDNIAVFLQWAQASPGGV